MAAAAPAFARYQQQMTAVFLACFALGAGATFVHPWLPVLFVFIYFGIGLFTTRAQRNSERFADSLYYLGFLLTLVALLNATLGDKVTEQIVQNLGTGLSTTLAGLALRVVVLQFRETVSDQEEEAQAGLEAEVRRVLDTFSALAEDVRKFHSQFTAEANAFAAGMIRMSAAVNAGARQMEPIAPALEAGLRSALESFGRRLEQVELPADLFARQAEKSFRPIAAPVAAAAAELEASLSGMTTRLARLEQSLAKLGELDIEGALERQRSLAAGFERLNDALGGIAARMQAMSGSTEAMATAAAKLSALDPLAASLSQELAAVQRTSAGVRQGLDAVRGELAGVRQDLGSVRDDLGGVRADLGGVRAATGELIDFARKELQS